MKRKISTLKKYSKEISFRVTIVILITLGIIKIIASYDYSYELKKAEEDFYHRFSHEVDTFQKTISSTLVDTSEDLYILLHSNEFDPYIEDQSEINRKNLEALFERYIKNKFDFLQLRFIDKNGNEVIRVDKRGNDVLAIPKNKLQYKGDRYYFKESIGIKKDYIYLSNIDLNIENDSLTLPYLPVIRFATPIYNNEELLGIFIINIEAEFLLKNFDEVFNQFKPPVKVSLLDNDGFHIYDNIDKKVMGYTLDSSLKKQLSNKNKVNITNLKNNLDDRLIQDDLIYFLKDVKSPPLPGYVFNKNLKLWNVLLTVEKDYLPTLYPNKLIFKKGFVIYISTLLSLFLSVVTILLYLKKKDSLQLQVSREILKNVNEGVVIFNALGEVIDLNEQILKYSGYSKDEILTENNHLIRDSFESSELYDKIKEVIFSGKNWQGEVWLKRKGGSKYPANISSVTINDNSNKKIEFIVFIVKDLSLKGTSVSKSKDFESIIPNKKLFSKLLEDEVRKDSPFSVITIRIKNFNEVLLKHSQISVEDLGRAVTEKVYLVSHESKEIAKLSSDTLVLISKNSKDRPTVIKLINRLISNFSEGFFIKNKVIFLDFEFGIVLSPEHGINPNELLRKSLLSLYALKYSPKNFIIYHHELSRKINRELSIKEQLSSSLSNNEFEIYLQPQMSSKENKVVGLESLIRWTNPILGRVSPAEFIPIAEEMGMINKITLWVVEESAKICKELNLFKYKNLKISVNLSAEDFKSNLLVEDITSILEYNEIDPSNFEVELTEGVLLKNYSLAKAKIRAFKEKNISIALDDFGTGYSSLSYLKELCVDRIKIDKSFIKDYPDSDQGDIAEFIIYLAKKLNIEVLAEGVEQEVQISFLKGLGCYQIQGFYYSKPLPKDKILDFIESYNN